MEKSLDFKLSELRRNPSGAHFILADAKDADMAWGIAAPGVRWPRDPARAAHFSLTEYLDQSREIVRQRLIDIMLTSVSSMSILGGQERLFDSSEVTPAIRANDTTDIWSPRGANYAKSPSLPFATCDLSDPMFSAPPGAARRRCVDLGLYSLTFNNDPERDRTSLAAFKAFRGECTDRNFRYFLEIFPPNAPIALASDQVAGFVNDQIVRTLAGVARENWPVFLKIPYFGQRSLEELVNYDAGVVIGILGGASGTTHDAFKLVEQARLHGARAALFGRKIKDAEHPLSFVSVLRAVADNRIQAAEAVKEYHGELERLRIPPKRSLAQDLELTHAELR